MKYFTSIIYFFYYIIPFYSIFYVPEAAGLNS